MGASSKPGLLRILSKHREEQMSQQAIRGSRHQLLKARQRNISALND